MYQPTGRALNNTEIKHALFKAVYDILNEERKIKTYKEIEVKYDINSTQINSICNMGVDKNSIDKIITIGNKMGISFFIKTVYQEQETLTEIGNPDENPF